MKDIAAMVIHFLSKIVSEKHVPKITNDKQNINDYIVIFLGRYQSRKLQYKNDKFTSVGKKYTLIFAFSPCIQGFFQFNFRCSVVNKIIYKAFEDKFKDALNIRLEYR